MVLLMEPRSRVRKSSDKRRRIRVVPSRHSPEGGEKSFLLDEVPFGAFGKLNEAAVHEPKPGATDEIVRWLAAQEESASFESLQRKIVTERPAWFTTRASLRLFERSLRLPVGEIVVNIVKDPLVLQDDPPASVLERWDKANFEYPNATSFYIEPIFDRPIDENGVALPLTELQKKVDGQWVAIRRRLWWWGASIRRHEARMRAKEERFMRRLERDALELEMKAFASGDRFSATTRMRSTLDERIAAFRSKQSGGGIASPTEVKNVRALLGERPRLSNVQARKMLSRREFGIAASLGLVGFPDIEYLRIDPIAAILIPGETSLRLVGHWDRWEVKINGQLELRTFVHV